MLYTLIIWLNLACAAPCDPPATPGGHVDSGLITVTVQVQRESGEPLESVPLTIYCPEDSAFVMTGETGGATAQLKIAPGADYVSVWLDDGRRHTLTSSMQLAALMDYAFYRESYFFDDFIMVPVKAGVTNYAVDIVAHDAITVTGHITNIMQWADDRALVAVRGGVWHTRLKSRQPFEVKGVQEGVAGELLFMLPGSAVLLVPLSAEQTQDDFHLGAITLPEVNGTATVQITMQDAQGLFGPGGIQSLQNAVTLIRSDASLILVLLVKNDGTAVVPDEQSQLIHPALPQGSYYLCPGVFNYPLQDALLTMIRDKKLDVLDAHNVPKIEAPGSLTFSAREARDAIIAAAGGLP